MSKEKKSTVYSRQSGVCLETQFFPNAINEPNFEAPMLKKDEENTYKTVYQFSIAL